MGRSKDGKAPKNGSTGSAGRGSVPSKPRSLTERQAYLFKLFAQQVEGDRKNGTRSGGAWMSRLVGMAQMSGGLPVTVGDHGKFEKSDILLIGDLFGVRAVLPEHGFSMVMSEDHGVFGDIASVVAAMEQAEEEKAND